MKKYILANSITEAIKLESKQKPDDVFLDEKSEPQAGGATAMGFYYQGDN
jgi:hypothetical protein